MKHHDENDRAKAGTLPKDPKDGTKVVAEAPRVLSVKELLAASMERALVSRKTDRCTTGHYRLDSITGGFRPGFVWVFGADTSWGKSSFLISIVDENLKAGKRVLIVSSEDTEEVYGDRLMVRRAQVNAQRFRDQRLTREEMARVTGVASSGEQVPVFIDARRWPVELLAQHLDRVIKEQRIDLVAFDYLQEFQSRRRWQDERVKFREIASVMRHVVKSNKRSGIIFSQLTISTETKVPNKHNIRESRDVSNAAEAILIGFEPEQDVTDKTGQVLVAAGTKCVLVDKIKNGPRGAKVPLQWDAETASFAAVADPELNRYAELGEFGERYP